MTWLSTSTSTSIFKTTASFNLYRNINTWKQHITHWKPTYYYHDQHQNQHQHHQGRAGWGQCSTPGKQAGHLHEQGGTHASTGQNDGHGGDGDGDGDLYIIRLDICQKNLHNRIFGQNNLHTKSA